MSEKKRLNRRSFLRRIMVSGTFGGSMLNLVTGGGAGAVDTDPNDPGASSDRDRTDAPGHGHFTAGHVGQLVPRDSDHDPIDPSGRGRLQSGQDPTDRVTGYTDRDTTDLSGQGSGRPAGPRTHIRHALPTTGTQDHDGHDQPGQGRPSGLTDRDPSDRAGNGRGGAGGLTDHDGADQPGNGRGQVN